MDSRLAWSKCSMPGRAEQLRASIAKHCSAPTQKQPVKLGHRDLHPGWTTVVALAGEIGAFHVAQQAVHLGKRQAAMRLDRRLAGDVGEHAMLGRSEEHTSELQSLMRISYAVFCLKKKNKKTHIAN